MEDKQSGCLNVKHGHVSYLASPEYLSCETFQCFISLHGFVAFLRNSQISYCGCSYSLPATPAFFEGYWARATMGVGVIAYALLHIPEIWLGELLSHLHSGQSFKMKWTTPAEEENAGASYDREGKRKPTRGVGRKLPLNRKVSCFNTRLSHSGTFWRPNQVSNALPAQRHYMVVWRNCAISVMKLGLARADHLTESLRAYCVHPTHTAQLSRCNSSNYLD